MDGDVVVDVVHSDLTVAAADIKVPDAREVRCDVAAHSLNVSWINAEPAVDAAERRSVHTRLSCKCVAKVHVGGDEVAVRPQDRFFEATQTNVNETLIRIDRLPSSALCGCLLSRGFADTWYRAYNQLCLRNSLRRNEPAH